MIWPSNSWNPEPAGIWVKGEARTEIVVRVGPDPIRTLDLTFRSPVNNSVTVGIDGRKHQAEIQPNKTVKLRVPVEGITTRGSQNFVLSVETSNGFVPRLRTVSSNDRRFLGVLMTLDGVLSHSNSQSE